MRRFLGALMLSGFLMAPIAMQAAEQRYYDRDHRDYHVWNDDENRAYRHWLTEEQHHQWRDWNRASRAQQRAYWRWRHEHQDWR
jgi:hypothetical protein